MTSFYRTPVLRFKLTDNPYNSFLNKFKFNYFLPVNLWIENNNRKVIPYSMFSTWRDFHKFSSFIPYKPHYFIPQINILLKNYTNNNQTVRLDQRTLTIDYIEPYVIPSNKLPVLNIVPDFNDLTESKNISHFDIHTHFKVSSDNNFINFPVYKRMG